MPGAARARAARSPPIRRRRSSARSQRSWRASRPGSTRCGGSSTTCSGCGRSLLIVDRRSCARGSSSSAQAVAALVARSAARVRLGAPRASAAGPTLARAILGDGRRPRFPACAVAEAAAVILTVAPHLVRPLQRPAAGSLLLGVAGALVVGGGHAARRRSRLADRGRGGGSGPARLRHVGRAARAWTTSPPRSRARRRSATGSSPPTARTQACSTSRGDDRTAARCSSRSTAATRTTRQLVAKLWRAALVPRRRPAAQAEPEPGGRARGVRDAARAQRGRRDARGRDAAPDDRRTTRCSCCAATARPLGVARAGRARRRRCSRGGWQALDAARRGQDRPPAARPLERRARRRRGRPRSTSRGATVAPTERSARDRPRPAARHHGRAGRERAGGPRRGRSRSAPTASPTLLPYLQSAALRTPLRKALKAAGIDIDELRAEAAEAVGGELPELVKLRRRHLVDGDPGRAARARGDDDRSTAASGVDWGDVLVDGRGCLLGLDRARRSSSRSSRG